MPGWPERIVSVKARVTVPPFTGPVGAGVRVGGAGGSVGSELIRHICRYHPQAVALLEMNELHLYQMEMECRQRFGYVRMANFLVDIRHREALERVRSGAKGVMFPRGTYLLRVHLGMACRAA